MEHLSAFVDSLQEIMTIRNIKPVDIHKATGISFQAIYGWLKNNIMPKLSSLEILADYFECSVNYLCGRKGKSTIIKRAVWSSFSERLRMLMNKNGISIRKLSAETKISTSGIHRFLTGTGQPLLENLTRLSVFFDCTIDYLLGREN